MTFTTPGTATVARIISCDAPAPFPPKATSAHLRVPYMEHEAGMVFSAAPEISSIITSATATINIMTP